MSNPILVMTNAGYGETPLPSDALLKPGDKLNVISAESGEETEARIVAVVPVGVPFDYAIADQNGLPRPLVIEENRNRSTTYVIEIDGSEVRVSQAKMLKGLTAACPDCLGTGRGSAADPELKCGTCGGAGRTDVRGRK